MKRLLIATPTNTTTLTMSANGTSRPTNTGMFVGFTTNPYSGDVVNILIPQTLDSVHPSNTDHAVAGVALNAWATAKLIP